MHLLLRPSVIAIAVQHGIDPVGIQPVQDRPAGAPDLALGHPNRKPLPELASQLRLIVALTLDELVLEPGLLLLFSADLPLVRLARHDARQRAPFGVGETADAEGVVDVDGVEGVDEFIARDVADLGFDVVVVGVAVDDVGGAVGAEVGFVFARVGDGDDGAEAGQGAGLHAVLAAVAAGADDQDRLFAVVDCVLGSVLGGEGKGQAESVRAEDGPEWCDDVADERGAVVVGQVLWDLGAGRGV